jgi:hypothetical protein
MAITVAVSTEKVKPAVVGGNMLMRAEAGTEEVAQFIVASTEPFSRSIERKR